jgi:alpha-tubulin suppressor-like RCC1 family protein
MKHITNRLLRATTTVALAATAGVIAPSATPIHAEHVLPPAMIAASSTYTCMVNADHTASCWGSNSSGQLGNGTTTDSVQPVRVLGLTGIVEVAAGVSHACARTAAGDVWCWGADYGLGTGGADSTVPVQVVGLTDVAQISAGQVHTCAVRTSGAVACWGGNNDGQLGDGTKDIHFIPVEIDGLSDAVMVSGGSGHTCAVAGDGEVWCWGLGYSLVPSRIVGVEEGAIVSAGAHHSCAALRSGRVVCWGTNGRGELGDGTTDNSTTPVTVSSLESVVSVDTSRSGTCALQSDGQVSCWGAGSRGLLGEDFDDVGRTIPGPVVGLDDAVALAVGSNHACAQRIDATVWCWGDSSSGQVGSGLPANVAEPTVIPGLAAVKKLAAGTDFTCAALLDGSVRCWGINQDGQLGLVSDAPIQEVVVIAGLSDVSDIDAGLGHVCAVLGDATMRCWGTNRYGELGDGTTEDSSAPVVVVGVDAAVRVATGRDHTCARMIDGTMSCWGSNQVGQLGIGSTIGQSLPTTVPTIANVGNITAGDLSTCASLSSGEVACWGRNQSGQLGDGTVIQREAPVQIDIAPNNYPVVDAANSHTCASRLGRTICWGENNYGQLGDGSFDDRLSPVEVIGSIGGRVRVGARFSCILTGTGSVKCWGDNNEGQLGDGTFDDRLSPVDVAGVTGASDLVLGNDHACLVHADRSVACWGSNLEGQLGQPSYFTRPTQVASVAGSVGSPEIPLVPARLLDTRAGEPTSDSQYAGGGQRPAGSTLELPIAGRGGVDSDAAAAVVNVTAVNGSAPGFVTVYPCDAPRPLASSLNYLPGTAVPNELIARLSPSGSVCLYTLQAVDLVVDVVGYLPATPGYTPLVPARLLDTRAGEPTSDGQYAGGGQRPAGSTLELPIAGRGGVDSDAAAAVVNVTAVNGSAAGFVTVYPCDAPRPLASSLNYLPGTVVPNELVTRMSSAGTVCLYTLQPVDLVVDVVGYLSTTPGYTPLVPARLLDTRPGETTSDGQYAGGGQRPAGSTFELAVAGRGRVSVNPSAVVVNVTVTGTTAPGFVTVYPCDSPRPLASSLNYSTGTTAPNELVARTSATGTICLYTLQPVDLVVDVVGEFA